MKGYQKMSASKLQEIYTIQTYPIHFSLINEAFLLFELVTFLLIELNSLELKSFCSALNCIISGSAEYSFCCRENSNEFYKLDVC